MGLYISVSDVLLHSNGTLSLSIFKPTIFAILSPIILQLAPESNIVLTGTLLIFQDKVIIVSFINIYNYIFYSVLIKIKVKFNGRKKL